MRRFTKLSIESLEFRRLLAAVDIPSDLTGAAGAIVAVPIQIDTAGGVRAAEIRLSYNNTLLDIDSGSIQAGSVWVGNSDTQVTANVNDATGTIVLFVSSANPLADIAGSLAVLNFTISSGANVGDTSVLNLTSVTLNEGAVPVTPAPVAGTDSTDGLLTVIATPIGNRAIGGFVFADANRNDTLDVGEAIPGVTLTLTNLATGATQQTTTAADGRYSFSNLVAGAYQISEQQPAAYFEGGVNSLTVQLTAGSDLNNQNFIEGGLNPAAIFTRLRTTLVMPVGSMPWQNAIANIVQTVAAESSFQNLASSSDPVSGTDLVGSAAPNGSAFARLASTFDTAAESGSEARVDAGRTDSLERESLVGEGEFAKAVSSSGAAYLFADLDALQRQRLVATEEAFRQLIASDFE